MLRLDSWEAVGRMLAVSTLVGKWLQETSVSPPSGEAAGSSVRTMAQAPRLFWWAEKSANKSERGFNNPMATSDQSVKKSGIAGLDQNDFGGRKY